jgi:hypothetical protein
MAGKKRGQRLPPPLPAPDRSSCFYVRIDPTLTGMFRFLLEAEDNLGYMSVVDRWAGVLQVLFSPHQEQAVRAYLEGMREQIPMMVFDFSS